MSDARKAAIAIGVLAIVMAGVAIVSGNRDLRHNVAAIRSSANERAGQPGRLQLLKLAIDQGFVQRVEITDGRIPHVWVTPSFVAGSLEARTNILYGIWKFYCIETNADVIVVRHSVTGGRLGSYSSNGLEWSQ